MYRLNPYDCGVAERIREINAQYPKPTRTVYPAGGEIKIVYDYREGTKTVINTKTGAATLTPIPSDEQ